MLTTKINVLILILIINSVTFNSVYSRKCKHKEYECENKQSCISRSYICNGVNDCSDGSDESVCSSSKISSTISSSTISSSTISSSTISSTTISSTTISSTILSSTISSTSILDLFLGPMKGYIMGTRQKIYNNIGSLYLCASLCIHTSCQSINYIGGLEECHLNNSSKGDIGLEFINDSNSIYYSKIYATTSSTTSSTKSSTKSSSTSSTRSSTTSSTDDLRSMDLIVISDKIVNKNLKDGNNYVTYVIPISIVIVIGFVVIKRRQHFRNRAVPIAVPIDIVQSKGNISTDNIYLTPYPIESEMYEPIHNYEEINT